MSTALTEAAEAFRARFGHPPAWAVTAPGRVNLIGEHTDYSLLPVMPFAIDREVAVAAGPAAELAVTSTSEPGTMTSPLGTDRWHRYVAAALEVTGHVGGLEAVVATTLPATGGLASSSALTMAFVTVCEAVAGRPCEPRSGARLAAEAERAVGVESGAMDQTVIAHGKTGHALRIDFAPDGSPAWRPVRLPRHLAVVVAYSGSPAHKSAGARHAYNRAVVAGRAASLLIAASLDLPMDRLVLGAVQGRPGAEDAAADLPATVSAAEAARRCGVDVEYLAGLTTGSFAVDEPLPVRAVAMHVLSEARRVDEAEGAVLAADLRGLGRVLDESQVSLVRFGASTPGLDAVVGAMRAAGAVGARLTGAGFGGNAIALCSPDRAGAVAEAAVVATGGPAFRVAAADGLTVTRL